MPTTKTLTVGELTGALARVPMHTPVRCYVRLDINISNCEGDTAPFQGQLAVTNVQHNLNEVTLEVKE
jgi:hypothetical protein